MRPLFTVDVTRCSRRAGKTWSEQDFHQLVGDLESRVFDKLGDETWFYPGHGDDSTLGDERPKLPEWKERGW